MEKLIKGNQTYNVDENSVLYQQLRDLGFKGEDEAEATTINVDVSAELNEELAAQLAEAQEEIKQLKKADADRIKAEKKAADAAAKAEQETK